MKQKRHQMRKRSESTDFTIHAEAPTYDFIKNETCILYPEVTQGPYWYPPSELLQRDMVQDQVCDLFFGLGKGVWEWLFLARVDDKAIVSLGAVARGQRLGLERQA
jgi:hypothetical protein